MKQNAFKLAFLQSLAKVSEEEKPMLEAEINRNAAKAHKGLAQLGSLEWRKRIWAAIGKNGNVIPDVISR